MHSNFLLFIDESGDHGLANIDRHYPVFVLCAALIRKDVYAHQLSPMLADLKMEIWGHDEVVLHEHDIRKPAGIYGVLQLPEARAKLSQRISDVFRQCDFMLISSIIRKVEYAARYPTPRDPYTVSMSFVLERAFLELNSRGEGKKKTWVVVECRGRLEDAQLRSAFEQIVNGNNACGRALPFGLIMIPKAANSPGLQLADLAARPIGVHSIRPDQGNRAYQEIEPKIRRDARGMIEGWGVKSFP